MIKRPPTLRLEGQDFPDVFYRIHVDWKRVLLLYQDYKPSGRSPSGFVICLMAEEVVPN